MRRRRALTRAAAVVILLIDMAVAVPGCGPIEYLSQVSDRAASAVAAAKLAQAERYAPYEYTAAEAYLHKAREEAGYSQYQDAIEFGRKAEQQANRARAMAVERAAAARSGVHGPVPETR